MNNIISTLSCLVVLLICFSCSESEKSERVGNRPPDAFVEGSKYPFYGSQDGWNRRFFYEHIKDYYKRRGQRQMLDLVEGRPEEAFNYCNELLAADPDDLESLYNRAIAQAQLNNVQDALESMKEAVDKGLPFSRFLAGPRKLLEPLKSSSEFQKYAAEKSVQLIHGPLIGCLTDQSAKFWVRTYDEVSVQVVVSKLAKMRKPITSDVVMTKAGNDYTAIAEIRDLQPETRYYYDVLLDGKSEFKPDYQSFRTYAKKGSATKFTIGFGGGAGYVPENERIWDVIKIYNPAAFLFLGDNIYMNMPEEPNGVHYYTYYRRQSRPEFRRLVSSTCIYAIWDDQDCATDDCFMGPYRDKPSWKMSLFHFFKFSINKRRI